MLWRLLRKVWICHSYVCTHMYFCVCVYLCIHTHVHTTILFLFRTNLKFASWKVLMNKSLGTVHHITVRGRPYLLFSNRGSNTSKRRHLWALQDLGVRLYQCLKITIFVCLFFFFKWHCLLFKKKQEQPKTLGNFFCSVSATGLFSFSLKLRTGKAGAEYVCLVKRLLFRRKEYM